MYTKLSDYIANRPVNENFTDKVEKFADWMFDLHGMKDTEHATALLWSKNPDFEEYINYVSSMDKTNITNNKLRELIDYLVDKLGRWGKVLGKAVTFRANTPRVLKKEIDMYVYDVGLKADEIKFDNLLDIFKGGLNYAGII